MKVEVNYVIIIIVYIIIIIFMMILDMRKIICYLDIEIIWLWKILY